MKKIFKAFGEIIVLFFVALCFTAYSTICAEHGFQTYHWYALVYGFCQFMLSFCVLIVINTLVTKIQKLKKGNK